MTQQNKIEIYTVSYCPYCKKAKAFLTEHNQDFIEYDCDIDEEKHRKHLQEKFNLKQLATFPQIMINNKYIGGCSDLIEKFEQGEIIF